MARAIGDAGGVAGESILLVDDDAPLRALIGDFLRSHGFAVREAEDGKAMRAALAQAPSDLVILDVMMPGEDGLSCLRALQGDRAPSVIMLSALAGDIDRIVGLESGADDYVAKPCNPRELLARVRSVLRRRLPPPGPEAQASILAFAGWRLDESGWILRDPLGQPLTLSASEIRLLAALVRARGAVLNRDQLMDAVHGIDGLAYDRAIDIHISRLRRKLQERGGGGENGGDLIRTVRGAGYALTCPVERL
ncbi:MAG: response regulator transcription factor [Novosphingobium sp.]|nr:MAG: response regulator transcription factor [Novosphingobium sp.]